MAYSIVLRLTGLILLIMSLCMSLAAAWGLFEVFYDDVDRTPAIGESEALFALVVTMLIGGGIAALLLLLTHRSKAELRRREAVLLVALSWLLGGALSALPYRIWAGRCNDALPQTHVFRQSVDCYFESISGLTTTGATVLKTIDTLPKSLLLWRSFTHWIGGLGIIVLFVAVLPSLGVGGKRVFRIESPGPTPEGVRPRIQAAARILWLIYLGLTVAEIITLRVLGMDWFDSVCHTFATLATGGFSTRGASIAAFNSPAIEWAIVVFMTLAGVNFGLYYLVLLKRWKPLRSDRELRLYLTLLAVSTVVVTALILNQPYQLMTGEMAPPGLVQKLRDAAFQVVSVQTTTGFGTADFDQWSFAAKAILVASMFVGGCAGSTAGGIKVIRCLIAARVTVAELEHVYHPNVVRPVRIGKAAIDPDLKLATMVYLFIVFLLFAGGTAAIMLAEGHQPISITTAATASAATLNNIGPGLDLVGATQNYGWFTQPAKVVMILLMVLGRLEVYSILILLLPRFWMKD